MSVEQNKGVRGFESSDTRICALVGNFSDGGIDIAYRYFQTDQPDLDNISLDFYGRTIVKRQKPKRGIYVR
jgi:hypothetical protein